MAQLKNNFAKQGMGRASALALTVAGIALFAVAAPGSAKAGFEWVPPAKPMMAPVQDDKALLPEMPALPRDFVETIDMGAQTSALPPSVPASPLLQPAARVPSAPFAAPETISAPDVRPDPTGAAPVFSPRLTANRATANTVSAVPLNVPAVATLPSSAYEEAVGFGADIPLALAMRQIVPAQYGYVFSGGVDQGARIDWNGGRPWNEVLADAVRPHGLEIAVTGQTVRIFPQGQNPVPEMTAAAAAPMLTGIRTTKGMTAGEPMREVYVRRNSSSGPVVAERMPGEQAVTTQNTPVVLTEPARKSKGKSGFWSHFGLESKETTTIRNEEKIISRQGAVQDAVPATAPAARELVAEMHDSQIYESEINAPLSLTSIPAERVSQAGNPYMMDYWSAEQGDSLRNVLQNWSRNAGVELRWTAAADYPLPAPVRLQGSYTDALSQVLGAYDENGPRPLGRLHPNLPSGPSVLIIESSNS